MDPWAQTPCTKATSPATSLKAIKPFVIPSREKQTNKQKTPFPPELTSPGPNKDIFVDFTGRVRSGFSWNLDNSVMVLGPAELVEHNDRISLSAGALLESKDVYPACGGSLDWKVHPQSSSHACLPASSPHLLQSQSPDHI